MTAPKTVLIGDRVRYESAAGTVDYGLLYQVQS